MSGKEYLEAILEDQTLDPDGPQVRRLQEKTEQVERLLNREFEKSAPRLRRGGSGAKGTMIQESYDLDLAAHFQRDDTGAGETLEDIYNNVARALAKEFVVERRRSALRLRERVEGKPDDDLHIDVVPGRFVDDEEADVFLHQEEGTKERLKTNLETHIHHVKRSGVRPAIRLQKLWRVRRGLAIKTFVLELLVIDSLKDNKDDPVDEQLRRVWTHFTDDWEILSAKDPANECGNDLSPMLTETIRRRLRDAAKATLEQIDQDGWEAVFGPLPEKDDGSKAERAARLAAPMVGKAPKPWAPS